MLLFAVTVGAVLLVQGTRKVPVQYAKRIVGNRQYGGARQYIPLKVNAAGVMPIIFAQAIMFIPHDPGRIPGRQTTAFMHAFTDINSFWYNRDSSILIVAFTYFYTAITVRPTQMAEDMKRNNGFIPGVKPGKKTAEYLDTIMTPHNLPGSIFLGIVAILPAFARFFGISQNFAQFFGGTSLLIMVGVVLDTLQQVESHLMMHHYDGLMKEGKIKGAPPARLIDPDCLYKSITKSRLNDLSQNTGRNTARCGLQPPGVADLGEVARWIEPGVTTRKLDTIARNSS